MNVFKYNAYYKYASTVPKKVVEPNTQWVSSNQEFIDFINNRYNPIQRLTDSDSSNLLIFKKRGNASLSSQVNGACSTLLLAILSGRSFQSK